MPQDFTRSRKLSFTTVFTLILRSGVKSLQLMLNEFILHIKAEQTITASAFSQARKKLKHTAFKELNQDIVSLYYAEQDIKTFQGLRVLAFDGSKLTLPNTDETKKIFGSRAIGSHTHQELGTYARATFEACYDVLNHIAVESTLNHGNAYEVDLAEHMLEATKTDDLLLFDRGYASYPFLANLTVKKINYLVRCTRSSCAEIQHMFESHSHQSVITQLRLPAKQAKKVKQLGLPDTIPVRLIKVQLSTGEIEVLATSLMDESKFPAHQFGELYYLRWGVETFFSKLKGRLFLENFTGKSVEAIRQDFWSTILLSNLETMVTEDIEVEMNSKLDSPRSPQKINKAVSFNAIKNLAFDILSADFPANEIIAKLTQLFMTTPTLCRKERHVPRQKISDTRSLNFQRRAKKAGFLAIRS